MQVQAHPILRDWPFRGIAFAVQQTFEDLLRQSILAHGLIDQTQPELVTRLLNILVLHPGHFTQIIHRLIKIPTLDFNLDQA